MPRQISISPRFTPCNPRARWMMMTFGMLVGWIAWPASGAVSFVKEIAPIFQAKCVTCHNAEKAKGRYRLDTFTRLQKPGESDEAPLVGGEPQKSHLYALLISADADDRMPQKDDPLPAAQIQLIATWIREGAKFDGADADASLATIVASTTRHPTPPKNYSRPEPILGLAFHPDGSQLAASGYHEITIWNPTNGTLLRRISNQPRQVHAIAYSPDGKRIAVAGGFPGRSGEVRLIRQGNGFESQVLATAGDTFLTVTFAPDGKLLLAGGADNSIRVFETSSGREIRRLDQHADWITDLAVAPDGIHFASASRDKTARLFKLESGELDETYDGHGALVFAVAFSADSKRIFSGGRDRELHAWSAKDARRMFVTRGFAGEILRVVVHQELVFTAASDRRIRQHRIQEKRAELVRSYDELSDTVYSLALHPDHSLVAAGCHDGSIRVWNFDSGELVKSFIAAP